MSDKTDVSFRITGPCLSLLLRDCECSASDQMGFLIGEKTSITTQTISDEEMEEERTETTLTVTATFPIGLPFVFCSPLGRVNANTLREILGNCEKDVLGWYMFRRNLSHRPSLRDTLLHSELLRTLRHLPPQYFLFSLITSSQTDRNATHSLRFTFSALNQRRFQPVSVLETNLGEPEDSNYKRKTTIDDSFEHVQQVFRTINQATNSKQAMTLLHSEVNRHVAELEDSVTKLQAEVDSRLQAINSTRYSCTEAEKVCQRKEENLPSTSSRGHLAKLSAEY